MGCQCFTPYLSPAVVAAMEDPVVLYTFLAIAVAVYVVKWRTHPVRMYHLLGNPCVLLTYVYRPPAQRDPHRGRSLRAAAVLHWGDQLPAQRQATPH